jgi:hypothetical protein
MANRFRRLALGIGLIIIGLAPVLTIALAAPPSPRPSASRPSTPQPPRVVPPSLDIADRPIFRAVLRRVSPHVPRHDNSTPLRLKSIGSILQSVAMEFLGAPYVAGLLDRTPQERLVVNLRQFDCLLLVETVLALGRSIRDTEPELTQSMVPSDRPGLLTASFTPGEFRKSAAFITLLESLRYRSGKRQDYCSRLHYFADWVGDNQRRGLVRNLTPDLGGLPLVMSFNFMTQHRSLYPALADNAAYACLQRVETALNGQRHSYLPTAAIRSQYNQLKAGDIVAVATRVRGLDVTHVGLVYRDQGQVGLIHAAPGAGVKLSPDLERYVSRVEDSIGIMVARPIEPR